MDVVNIDITKLIPTDYNPRLLTEKAKAQILVWAKNTLVMGHSDYHFQHEFILYGWLKDTTHTFYGDRKQTTLWSIDKPSRSSDHPTTKPIALITKALLNSSKQDDIVLDLFMGSGSTLIACEQTKRIAYGCEIDPKYVDVCRKRYWKFTHDNNEEGWEEGTRIQAGGGMLKLNTNFEELEKDITK